MSQNLTSIRRDVHGIPNDNVTTPISISTSAGSPTPIGYAAYSGGSLYFSANANAAVTVYFLTRNSPSTGWIALCDRDGAAVTRVLNLTGSKAIPIPDEAFGCLEIGIYASSSTVFGYTLKG
jgi:hypothetical protein